MKPGIRWGWWVVAMVLLSTAIYVALGIVALYIAWQFG